MSKTINELFGSPWHLAAVNKLRNKIMVFTSKSVQNSYDWRKDRKETKELKKMLTELEDCQLRLEAEIKEMEYTILMLEAKAKQNKLRQKNRIFCTASFACPSASDIPQIKSANKTVKGAKSFSGIPCDQPLSSCKGDFEKYMWQYYNSFHNRRSAIYNGLWK